MVFQVLAAVLYALSFKPVGIWMAAPIAIALQLHALRKHRWPEFQAFLFAFISSLIILSWSKTFVGALPWVALAVLQGLLAIPIGLATRFSKSVPLLVFAILSMEEVRARFPFGGFSWTRVGFSQSDSPFAGIVALTGVIGLSFVTILISQLILNRSVKLLVALLVMVIAIPLIQAEDESTGKLAVRAIQGGVPMRGLEFNARAQAVLDNHISATLDSFNETDEVILWPENSIDIDPTMNSEVARKISDLADKISTPLIAGVVLDDEKLFNATVLIDGKGEIRSTYIKRYLTPFGEYIPLRGVAQLFSPHVERVSDFSVGNQLVIHKIQKASIGSIICYELLNDGLVREASKKSELLVVHTNSATFSGSSEGEQQMAITRLRAVESGRSVVSISTTGPSAFIDRRGEVTEKLDDGQVGSLSGQVSLHGYNTVANKLGGFATLLVLLFSLFAAVFSLRKGKF
jgi:apolipoprotein N-acyltransferase